MIAVKSGLFKPGRILASPACLEELERAGQNLWEFMARHIAGDWGVVRTTTAIVSQAQEFYLRTIDRAAPIRRRNSIPCE